MTQTAIIEPASETPREQLVNCIYNLEKIRARLPVLQAIATELLKVGGGKDPILRNSYAFQIVRDSFDMLVIDLTSLREGMIERNHGLLNRLPGDLQQIQAPKETDFSDDDEYAHR